MSIDNKLYQDDHQQNENNLVRFIFYFYFLIYTYCNNTVKFRFTKSDS